MTSKMINISPHQKGTKHQISSSPYKTLNFQELICSRFWNCKITSDSTCTTQNCKFYWSVHIEEFNTGKIWHFKLWRFKRFDIPAFQSLLLPVHSCTSTMRLLFHVTEKFMCQVFRITGNPSSLWLNHFKDWQAYCNGDASGNVSGYDIQQRLWKSTIVPTRNNQGECKCHAKQFYEENKHHRRLNWKLGFLAKKS